MTGSTQPLATSLSDRTHERRGDTYLVLVNALLASLLSLSNVSWGMTVGSAFLVAAILTQHIMISVAVGILVRALRAPFSAPQTRRLIAVTLFSLHIIVMVMNTKIFELYRFHINSMVLNLLMGGALNENLAFSALQWTYIFALALGIVGAQALLVWRLYAPHVNLPSFRLRKLSLYVIALFLVTQTTYAWHDAKGDTRLTSQARYVPWYYPVTMKRALRRMGVEVVAQSTPRLDTDTGSHLVYPRNEITCTAPATPHNLLVIMVDSLRFDMLTPEAMPHTYRFAENAMRFDTHYSTGNSTRFGIFGFFYGLPSSYWHAMLAEQRGAVLIDKLLDNQYRMIVQASAPLNSPEFDRTVFSRMRDQIHWAPDEKSIVDRDRHITHIVNDAIREPDNGKPFFAFLFLDAPHGFAVPEGYPSPFQPMLKEINYLTLGEKTDRDAFFNRYKNSVHFNDSLIKELLDSLRDTGQLDNTIVMITGDHGQEFDDVGKNYWGHNSNFSDYQIKVPMVLHWPGKAAMTETAMTSHEDVAPTLMKHMLGCQNPLADYSTGRSLFAADNPDHGAPRALFVESWSKRALVDGQRIFQFSDFGGLEAFDLQYNPLHDTSPDPASMAKVLEQMTIFMQ
jgi:membrane-anchored protein YejM (alkaline phosphatase superfamily)